MTSYELSRDWFDFCFSNPEKVKPVHTAIYFFTIEHCNRLGWKDKFGLPSQMVMEAVGIKNWRTYSKALREIVDWGFIEMIEISKNQYSSNIVAIVKNTKATTKALDKALQKHSTKQRQSIVSINKPLNNITKNNITRQHSEEVFQTFHDIKNLFPIPPKKESLWLDEIDRLNRIDKLEFKKIIEIVKWARSDNFWKNQFLSIMKLRKNNRDGIKYYKFFIIQMDSTGKEKTGQYKPKKSNEDYGFTG
jgi:hypothetical protein